MSEPNPSTDPDPFATTEHYPHQNTPSTLLQTAEQQALSLALSTGETIPGYEILDEIGRGGMGVVYRARQVAANRTVAVKMVLTGSHASPADLARFRGEIESAAQLQHPGIVQVYEVGEHHGLPFFSMEFCEGGSLGQRYGGRSHPPAVATAVVERLALAVEAAHLAGIVHRDLKPGNILITANGTIKVGDFGLAKKLGGDSGHTKSGAVMGTPQYMAPEQAGGNTNRVGPQADVYALGVILYELLTGRVPFTADSLPQLLDRVIHNDPPPIHDFAPDVPNDLVTVCLKCLAKEPGRRYPTAGALAEDLRRFQCGESITARKHTFVSRMAWMLERSHNMAPLAKFGGLLLWLAPLILIPELIAAWAIHANKSEWYALPGFVCRYVFGGGLFLYYCRGRIWPTNPAEQHLFGVWAAFLFSAILLAVNMKHETGISKYQALASLAGLAFVSLGAMYWGRFYLIGLSFLLLVPVLISCKQAMWLVPILYGLWWTAILIYLGLAFRKLRDDADGQTP
jgi:eukaryotic-like serine/threonine-protein kinase